jgi:3-oxoadipyl-CoA thiolase
MPQAVFVVEALRTPIGKHLGGLKLVRADDLAAIVLRATLERAGVEGGRVDEVVLGCANQAGEDNRNVARMALLLAGIPNTVPGITVNRLCASGLEAVNVGARLIALGDADVVLTGGVESMSRAPWVMGKPVEGRPAGNQTLYDSSLGWRFPNPRLEALFPLEAMGETAENVAEQHGISREDQDAFAVESHRRAAQAWAAGVFSRAVVPVPVVEGKGEATLFSADEGIRASTSVDALAKLKPAFRKGGTVTAGNSSTLNDGAASVLLMSERALREHGVTPLARWSGAAAAGVDPRIMGIGPVPAVSKLLARLDWSVGSLDAVELNEAFAAQALAVIRALGLDPERTNPHGGAIALGHPLGMSGARIVGALAHALAQAQAKRGIAALCVGVGQGAATALERD